MKYQHFSIREREKIQLGLWEKKSLRKIARSLNRSPSSVSREIKKNLDTLGRRSYLPRTAHQKALKKRSSRGREERLKNEAVRNYVIKELKKRTSPEQISGRIKEEINQTISHEAIYRFIYHQIYRDGYGEVKPGKIDLRPFLRRRKKRRTRKGTRRCQRIFKPKGASIEARPKVTNSRKRIGDWESDTVISKDQKPGINTLVERKTGLVFITRLKKKNARSTSKAVIQRLNTLPQSLRRTVTFDNGTENSNWEEIEAKTRVKCFFCHPYHSWERGTNENTNGLIRDFFPKGTDFTQVTEAELKYVEANLNNRPRKRLNWKTPLEAFSVALRS